MNLKELQICLWKKRLQVNLAQKLWQDGYANYASLKEIAAYGKQYAEFRQEEIALLQEIMNHVQQNSKSYTKQVVK